jgi:type VI secretion system secreted protein Hcp
MKVLRNHLARNIVVAAVFLAAVVALVPVARSGTGLVEAAVPGGTGTTPSPASFFDIFLDIPSIPGESTVTGHVGSIEVQSWSWGLTQATTTGPGGGGTLPTGRLTGHVTLIKRIDKATPGLMTRCVNGQTIPSLTVQLVRVDGQTYLKYDLKNVLVASITHADVDGDGAPDEKIELDLGGATLTYTQFDSAGKPLGQSSAQW